MGCDIHAYVEFSEKRPAGDDPYWQTFVRNGGERDYLMFGILAGVRVPEVQKFEPKGMPEGKLSYYAEGDYWLNVAPEANPDWADTEGWTSRERAEGYLKYGAVAEYKESGEMRRVSHPDWHSHSWLTADEFEQAIEHYREVVGNYYPTAHRTDAPVIWRAMLGAMRTFEKDGGQSRLVFWFDN